MQSRGVRVIVWIMAGVIVVMGVAIVGLFLV